MEEVRPVRLLIDQNLPAGLARHISDAFPGSRHVVQLLRDRRAEILTFATDPSAGLLVLP